MFARNKGSAATPIERTSPPFFEYNKAVIRPRSHSLLKDVAEVMNKNPQVKKIRVEGHTDSDGTAAKNRVPSQQRAEAVRKFLISLGTAEGRLVAKGYGEDQVLHTDIADEQLKQCVSRAAQVVTTTQAPGVKVDAQYTVNFGFK